jgi:hypothetical protein
MTRDQALEACVRAMLRRKNYSEDMWQDSPDQKNRFENEALAVLAGAPVGGSPDYSIVARLRPRPRA